MNKTALHDIQKTLNIIHNQIEAVDADTKTVTRKISIPKTKVIKQSVQQTNKPTANDAAGTAIIPIAPQKPLPNQQIS